MKCHIKIFRIKKYVQFFFLATLNIYITHSMKDSIISIELGIIYFNQFTIIEAASNIIFRYIKI